MARLYYLWQFAFNLVLGYTAKEDEFKEEFDSLVKVMASSIGSPCNPNKLSNTFRSVSNADLSPITIDNYLGFLQDAFLIEKALRYDIKGKKYIGTLSKYYFVVNNGSKRYYIQSALALPDKEKIEQESASLTHILDNFQKIIIVKDNIVSYHNEADILFIGLFDFLLQRDILE